MSGYQETSEMKVLEKPTKGKFSDNQYDITSKDALEHFPVL